MTARVGETVSGPPVGPSLSWPWLRAPALSLGCLVASLAVSSLALLAFGVDPVAYFRAVLRRALWSPSGLQDTLNLMGPLLLVAASLATAFRAGLWNLGGDAQFVLGALAANTAACALVGLVPAWAVLVAGLAAGAAAGAAWSILPALLRAYQGVNEIITTLMMTFLGLSLANILVKLVVFDPGTSVPQTRTLDVAARLATFPGTRVSCGLPIGIVAVLIVHGVMTRTALGLRLRVVGANPRAAIHCGLDVPALTLFVFMLSAALAGLGGALDVLGLEGNVRADWDPAFTLDVVPLVFLARFNGLASILFVFLFSILSIGGASAARVLDLPNFFTLVIVAILLMVLALADCLDHRLASRPRS